MHQKFDYCYKTLHIEDCGYWVVSWASVDNCSQINEKNYKNWKSYQQGLISVSPAISCL